MLSQAARISSVMSSSVALPCTGTETTARWMGSPTKLHRSFHSRIMWIENWASRMTFANEP